MNIRPKTQFTSMNTILSNHPDGRTPHLFLIQLLAAEPVVRFALDANEALEIKSELSRSGGGADNTILVSLVSFGELSESDQAAVVEFIWGFYFGVATEAVQDLYSDDKREGLYILMFGQKLPPLNPHIIGQIDVRFKEWLVRQISADGLLSKVTLLDAAKNDVATWIATTEASLVDENMSAVGEKLGITVSKVQELLKSLQRAGLRGQALVDIDKLCVTADYSVDAFCATLGINARSFHRDLVIERRINAVAKWWPPTWTKARRLRKGIAAIQRDEQRRAFLERHGNKGEPSGAQLSAWICEDTQAAKLSKPKKGRVPDPVARHIEALEERVVVLMRQGASDREVSRLRLAIAALSGDETVLTNNDEVLL